MLACHAGGPGSIPGRCKHFFASHLQPEEKKRMKCAKEQKGAGDGGYRSPYLSHAKRALYHLSYVPISVIQEQILLGAPSCVKVKLQVAFCCQGHCQPIRVTHVLCSLPLNSPSIAQLVERWTVVVLCQISIGRWFKSGSKDFCCQLGPLICCLPYPSVLGLTRGPGSSVGRALGF